MGLDKNNIPDEYLCEVCKPRPVDRKKARAAQARRRSEFFNSSSDDSPRHGKRVGPGTGGSTLARSASKKMNDRKAGKDKPGSGSGGVGGKGSAVVKEKNNKNKQYRKRKSLEKSGKPAAAGGGAKSMVKPRRKSAAMDNDYGTGGRGDGKVSAAAATAATAAASAAATADSDDEGSEDSGLLKEPTLDASQQLRSWIDQYEEAVTNHYSPELRARLIGAGNGKINGISQDLRPSVINAPVKSNVSLKGNGVKVMTQMNEITLLPF